MSALVEDEMEGMLNVTWLHLHVPFGDEVCFFVVANIQQTVRWLG